MQIELSKIKPSPKPIRTTWDEAKLDELKWSLMEEGQVEPIGVHENSHGYVIVWGHRRVEAARRAAWTEIDAVVVKQDEIDNLIQAGIENLASEEMADDDKADWAYRLNVEFAISVPEISRRSTVPKDTIYTWLNYRREKEAGVAIATTYNPSNPESIGMGKIKNISETLGNDLEAKKAVAVKVSEDNLTTLQTLEVARAYRDAPTPAVKAAILRQPIISRDTSADILRRSINRVELDTGVKFLREESEWEKEVGERKTMQDWDFAVKDFLTSAKVFGQVVDKIPGLIKYSKFSPEAARFAVRKIDALIDLLKTAREELEGVK